MDRKAVEVAMRYHNEFEWDPQKAKVNEAKHGVSFDDAVAVLEDNAAGLYHVEVFDDAHSLSEDRHITTASHPADRTIILVICWTDRCQKNQSSRGSSAPDMPAAEKGSNMPKQSRVGKVVRRSAGDGPASTEVDLARLRETMRRPVRTEDIQELDGTEAPVRRDEFGNLPRRPLGPLRQAILESLEADGVTRYELWKKARVHCATLSRSAVYEYLRGARDIGVEYAEALMMAANLRVVGQGRARPKRPSVARPKD
jgi:uncharacterized DUF497 family protein